MDPFFLILLFIASFGIGIIGALAGVGGGVLFTPLMMAFTDLNIDIIRSTGLALAMMGSAFVIRQFIGAGATRVNFILFVSLAL
ncbi:MAG: sulfite exporter TauE/SafE family protein, partial [Pyrobaculum sp.]